MPLSLANLPVVNMRELPTRTSKVVSQAIFSENISIDMEKDGWSLIKTPDGYTGWIQCNSYINLSDPYDSNIKTTRLAAHIYEVKDIEYGPILTVPFGSQLNAIDTNDPRWIKVALPDGKAGFIQKGDIIEATVNSWSDLVELSKQFIGLPYTWGGRSSFGYDCSGFVQMLYEQKGILLPRDSNQQILDSRLTSIPVEELAIGNLIFFGKSEHKIMHVGMSIGNGQFIHASSRENKPWIRISQLADPEWSGRSECYYPYRVGAKAHL